MGLPGRDLADTFEDPLRHGRIKERLAAADCLEPGDQVAGPDLLEEIAGRAGNDR